MLAGSLSPEDEDAVLAELEAITQVGLIIDYTEICHSFSSFSLIFGTFELSQGDVELPEVPSDKLPEAPEKKPGLWLHIRFWMVCPPSTHLLRRSLASSPPSSDLSLPLKSFPGKRHFSDVCMNRRADRSWMCCLFQRRNVRGGSQSQSESCLLRRSLAEPSCWTSTNCQTQTFPGELSPHLRPEIVPLCQISLRRC